MARPSLGGLVASRQGALVVAVLCAVLAACILVFALGRYKSNIQVSTRQATVLVATAEIPKGTTGDAIVAGKLYKSTPIVATQLTSGAISDASLLPGKLAGSAILAGQQLTVADFTSVTGGVTGVLPPNQRAMSVTISEAPGDTDVLQAGDHVDLYASFTAPDMTLLLAPDTLIIKPASGPKPVPSAPDSAGGATFTGASMVISVPATAAAEVTFAETYGTLYVADRPTDGTVSPRSLTTLASIEQASISTITALTKGPHK